MSKPRLMGAVMAAIALGSPLLASEAQAPVLQPSQAVEVRVRVTSGGRFLDDLTLGDFGLRENGKAQTLGSLALVRNGLVARQEGIEGLRVPPARSYTLLFQLVDWDPNLMEAVDHLFGAVLKPRDSLSLVTPFRPYHLQNDALALRTKAELSESMKDVLRKDVLRCGGEYRDLIAELRRLSRAIGGSSGASPDDIDSDPTTDAEGGFGLEMQIDRYRQALMKMEGIRLVDEAKLLAFAGSLRPVAGQKTVVLFYQREFRPEISQATMTRLMGLYQDNPQILSNLMDLFQLYKREKTFDVDKVKKAFADADIDFHFIFMEKKSQRVFGATMREQSEDTYPGFVEIA
ncbi:MAG TPA: hypothetical protein VKT17_00675, partial [Acidobacteriota bacterium]|nr:hypothetical protein [Acidobacteriota bacterium]